MLRCESKNALVTGAQGGVSPPPYGIDGLDFREPKHRWLA